MAKRTPRTEADDTTAASADRDPRASGGRANAEGRQSPGAGRSRTARETQGAVAEDQTPQTDNMYSPTEDEIRYRAYLLYIERGGGHGMDFEDWLQAERELKNRNR
jgi:Protein of unknown function (DUF2934)